MSEFCDRFRVELLTVIEQGGIVLWTMLILTIVLYSVLTSTWFGLFKARQAIHQLDATIQADQEVSHVIADIELFELDRLAWVERRLPVISVMIALAPLSGLLGTVSGMLATFSGMAAQHANKPIDSISAGISEALVTTQAGLFMAIPAALLFALLKSRVSQLHGYLEQYTSRKIIDIERRTV